MRSLVVLDKEKEIYVCVKMEEVVCSVETQIEANITDFDRRHRQRMPNWWDMNSNFQHIFAGIETQAEGYCDYKWFFDFELIKDIHINALSSLLQYTKGISKKYIINSKDLPKETQNELENNGFVINNKKNYEKAFEKDFLRFIRNSCTISEVKSPTGERITNYINLKEAFENREYLQKISYLLSKKIVEKTKKNLERYSLFCHTLNGACLAENISLMLGINIVYADRLNTTRQMRKLFMPDHIEQQSRCIIVTDLVCQGHEIQRAKDIVLMLGGTPELYVGVLDLGIHNDMKMSNCIFLRKFDSKDRNSIGYSIVLEGSV